MRNPTTVKGPAYESLITGCATRQEEAELEWDRQLREAACRRDEGERQLQQQSVATDAFAPAQITRTTAEPRPNAYIPDDIGIPKPYGVYLSATIFFKYVSSLHYRTMVVSMLVLR